MTKPPVPAVIRSKTAREWYARLQEGYAITDDGGQLLLTVAMQAFERLEQARADIDKHGMLIDGANGTYKANPALAVERDSSTALLRALRHLNLDVEATHDVVGRPSGSGKIKLVG